MGGCVKDTITNIVESVNNRANFVGNNNVGNNNVGNVEDGERNGKGMVVFVITMIIFLIIHLLVCKWLWSSVLIKLLPVVKPAQSVWQLLGLTVLLSLILGN